MLNSNYESHSKSLILLGKNYCRTDVGNTEESVYSSSETLSNHISNKKNSISKGGPTHEKGNGYQAV